eukprot:3786631-Amphidinium_carterae.2
MQGCCDSDAIRARRCYCMPTTHEYVMGDHSQNAYDPLSMQTMSSMYTRKHVPTFSPRLPSATANVSRHVYRYPSCAQFCSWRLGVQRSIAAASIQPQATFEWITQVEHLPPHHITLAHAENMYLTLDIKLSWASWRTLGTGELARPLYGGRRTDWQIMRGCFL